MPRGLFWSEEDKLTLISMYTKCNNKQMARFLNRSETGIKTQITKLRKEGRIGENKRNRVDSVPFWIPSTGILLAKTCPPCGRILPATSFTCQIRNGKKRWQTYCHVCRYLRMPSNIKDKRLSDAKILEDQWQSISKNMASNDHKEWSQEEDNFIKENEKNTDFQIAIELGRTYYSVRNRRYATLGIKKNIIHTFDEVGEWIIKFPNAMRELQNQFIRLGILDDWGLDGA